MGKKCSCTTNSNASMRVRALFILFVVGLAAPALAQKPAPPDLSGTWVLNTSKSKLPKNSVPDPETLVITCAGDHIEFAISSAGKQHVTAWTANGKEYTRSPATTPKFSPPRRGRKASLSHNRAFGR